MSFLHPYLLFVLLLPCAWLVWSWPGSRRRMLLLLKTLAVAAIVLALAEPAVLLPQKKIAELVLVDTSASISANDLERAAGVIRELAATRGSNWMRVVRFDRNMLGAVTSGDLRGGAQLRPISSAAGTGTNLEAALTGIVAGIPEGYLPRVLLLSDGKENEGSVVRALAQLSQLAIPADAMPLEGRAAAELRLAAVSAPAEAYSGEQVPIDLVLISPSARRVTVDIFADKKLLGQQTTSLHAGENQVRVEARVRSNGVVALGGRIRGDGAGEVQWERAIKLRRARVLYLSEDPAGSDSNLLTALGQANADIARGTSELDKDLTNFQLVILNNLDLASLSQDRKMKIENYVKRGGGLLLIGGERQVFKEDKQMDALDRALPAKLAPPDLPKGTCVALIIDKSSSMEGRKIELARVSAIGVVDHLRPADTIGVLIFDNSYQWAVPMRRVEDKSLIKRLISGITPDGGTQIAPALAEAYRRVAPSRAAFKHVVLLTDGISEEGDSLELAREASQHEVTISTVGLGQDVNRSYLEKVAATSGGRSYFLNDPAGLEQILLKDVETYSGSTAVEKPLTPLIANRTDILEGVGMESAPPLRGYARYTAKPDAETLLAIDKSKRDPLYVRWQYGLGRAAVFASDAKSRWAEQWINWPGFDKFWLNATRDLYKHNEASEASATFDAANGELVAHYQLSSDTHAPGAVPELYVLGPQGFREPLELKQTGASTYEGRLRIGSRTGLFRVLPASEMAAFPETGMYREEPEFADRGSDENLLREVASATGGRFNPPLAEVFSAAEGRRSLVSWQLWPAFLALALALNITELIVRKWSGLKNWWEGLLARH